MCMYTKGCVHIQWVLYMYKIVCAPNLREKRFACPNKPPYMGQCHLLQIIINMELFPSWRELYIGSALTSGLTISCLANIIDFISICCCSWQVCGWIPDTLRSYNSVGYTSGPCNISYKGIGLCNKIRPFFTKGDIKYMHVCNIISCIHVYGPSAWNKIILNLEYWISVS